MIIPVADLAADVRICLDSNMSSAQLADIADPDTLALDEIIQSKLVEAVRRVHAVAPSPLLIHYGHNLADTDNTNNFNITFYDLPTDPTRRGSLTLPEDFMRLIAFKMSDWERPVFDAITPDDPAYAIQLSRFKGLRGSPQRPVVAIVPYPEGTTLEFFSCLDDTATIVSGVYLPFPTIETNASTKVQGIDIAPNCRQAIVYTAAALTLHSLGSHDRAQQFSSIASSLLTIAANQAL